MRKVSSWYVARRLPVTNGGGSIEPCLCGSTGGADSIRGSMEVRGLRWPQERGRGAW